MKLQLRRMHEAFGVKQDCTCKDCCNLMQVQLPLRRFYKCGRYAVSGCGSSDWAKSWIACGMHNVPLGNERPLMKYHTDNADALPELEGQIEL